MGSPRKNIQIKKKNKLQGKKFQRLQQADIKQSLMKFAKEEYRNKKPLELRVLQLKPQVVFKKGAMLPNLLIKSLKGTAFVIYLDYGEEIRFYFFDLEGRSKGASTFPKTEKLLKEMHGKAKTLVKLPKTDPLAHVDQISPKIQELLQKKTLKMCQQHGIALPNIPTISVLQKLQPNRITRFGVKPDPNSPIIHLDKRFLIDPWQDFILDREVFLLLNKRQQFNSRDHESFEILASLWAIIQNFDSFQKNRDFKQLFNEPLSSAQKRTPFKEPSLKLKTIIGKKGMNWLRKIVIPSFINLVNSELPNQPISSLSPQSSHSLQVSLLYLQKALWQSGMAGVQAYSNVNFPFYSIVLFWFMKSGFSSLFSNYKNNDNKDDYKSKRFHPEINTPFILYEVLSTLHQNQNLAQKYHLDFASFTNSEDILLWGFRYYTQFYLQVANGRFSWTDSPLIPVFLQDNANPLFSNIITNIQNFDYLEALQYIPKAIISKEPETFKNLFDTFFFKHALSIKTSNNEMVLSQNQSKYFSIELDNKSDWILHQIEFSLECHPSNRIQAIFHPEPKITDFDFNLTLPIQLKCIGKSGSAKLTLWCSYECPIMHKKLQKRLIILPVKIE